MQLNRHAYVMFLFGLTRDHVQTSVADRPLQGRYRDSPGPDLHATAFHEQIGKKNFPGPVEISFKILKRNNLFELLIMLTRCT